MQHWVFEGSQTAPDLNLQVEVSQQVELAPLPGSQSSPGSTIPFPHCCNDMVLRVDVAGSITQVVLVFPLEFASINEPWR